MLSIIVCTVKPEQFEALASNIEATIGQSVDYELIGIDNRENNDSLACVYNRGAGKARYPNLLFVHEDVRFLTSGWYAMVCDRLAAPDCGVIGFAGTKYKTHAPSGWWTTEEVNVAHLLQGDAGGQRALHINDNAAFEEVAVLDGFCMFVPARVWREHPFDEVHLKGFHCYDIDFSLEVGAAYTNYVCCTIEVVHLSYGNFDDRWLRTMIEMHRGKWNTLLPRCASNLRLPERKRIRIEEKLYYHFLLRVKRSAAFSIWDYLPQFLKCYPLTGYHFCHLINLLFKKD